MKATLILLDIAILSASLPATLFAGRNQWTPVGPEGGVVSSLAADPQNPSTLYAATCAGIFKTADGGASWRPVNSGLGGIACDVGPGILAVDPQNSGTVYAVSGSQILKTTDGGARWRAISTLKTENPLRVLLIAPSDPNTLYASGDAGIFKSTDGGVTWAGIMGGGAPGSCCSNLLAVDPQAPETLYANICCPGGELLKSTDGGISWNPSNSGLPAIQVLAIDPQNTNILYAGNHGQIFKSTDRGASWNVASTGLPPPPAPSAGGITVLSMAVNPQTPTVIYTLIYEDSFSGQGGSSQSYFFLAVSTDGAASWTLATDPNLSAADLFTIAPEPKDAGTLYLGTRNGVLKTTDGGGHWNFTNSGLRALGVDSLVADSQTGGTLLVVTDCCSTGPPPYAVHLGTPYLFKSTDGGNSWFPSNSGLPLVTIGLTADVGVPIAIPGVLADPQHAGTLYALDVLAAAGLLVGDIMTELDGEPVESPEDLLDLLQGDRVGRQATLRVLRGGTMTQIPVTVGERPTN